jgi:hypothetical protein
MYDPVLSPKRDVSIKVSASEVFPDLTWWKKFEKARVSFE